MQSKLQELTEKLYSEGVEKVNKEAADILEKARSEAEKIIEDAKNQASQLLAQAEKDSSEKQKNVDSEIKLATQQAITSLKQDISNSLTLKLTEPNLKEVFSDKAFLKSLISKAVEGWASQGNFDMLLLLSEKDYKELSAKIENDLASKLNKGLVVDMDSQIEGGFKIGPKDGSYFISFTDEGFDTFLKAYLRPKTKELLFD